MDQVISDDWRISNKLSRCLISNKNIFKLNALTLGNFCRILGGSNYWLFKFEVSMKSSKLWRQILNKSQPFSFERLSKEIKNTFSHAESSKLKPTFFRRSNWLDCKFTVKIKLKIIEGGRSAFCLIIKLTEWI